MTFKQRGKVLNLWRCDRWFPVWVYLPWFNLGCLGLKLGFGEMGWFYADMACWYRQFSLYARIGNRRYRSNIRHFWRWSPAFGIGKERNS